MILLAKRTHDVTPTGAVQTEPLRGHFHVQGPYIRLTKSAMSSGSAQLLLSSSPRCHAGGTRKEVSPPTPEPRLPPASQMKLGHWTVLLLLCGLVTAFRGRVFRTNLGLSLAL